MRTPESDPIPYAECPLADQIRGVLAFFDKQDKDFAFNDDGEGTMFAIWMADLLERAIPMIEGI